jgi:hypothetical protein
MNLPRKFVTDDQFGGDAALKKGGPVAVIPDYLELSVLKRCADGFESFLGSDGQFTAEEFVQWCTCEACPYPLKDHAHAIAVGMAIVGQNCFDCVDAVVEGNRAKSFDVQSGIVWHFTGKWAGTPVQCTPAASTTTASHKTDSFSAEVNQNPVLISSSPTLQAHNILSPIPSPAKSSLSLDVVDDERVGVWSSRPVARHDEAPVEPHLGGQRDESDFFMSCSKVEQLRFG